LEAFKSAEASEGSDLEHISKKITSQESTVKEAPVAPKAER